MGCALFDLTAAICLCCCFFPDIAISKYAGTTRHYTFIIELKNVTRLCHTKSVVTVNGMYPGPRVTAREGDRLVVKVVNRVRTNISIHWHGIRQMRSGWADGPFITRRFGTFDNSTTAGILQYENKDGPAATRRNLTDKVLKPKLPPLNDTSLVANFSNRFRGLATNRAPKVPHTAERKFFFTVGLGSSPCPKNRTCQGPNGSKFAASVNNISFALPATALLQAHFYGQSYGIYGTDFPAAPVFPFNYTGTPPNNTVVINGTEVVVVPYNTTVEVVLQGTGIVGAESHPLHLHGFDFFVVGQGVGNFNPTKDPTNYNLVDPVQRNTIGVPSGGWTAIRFLADNPGVWLMHCHFDVHLS